MTPDVSTKFDLQWRNIEHGTQENASIINRIRRNQIVTLYTDPDGIPSRETLAIEPKLPSLYK